jgi:peptidylprolyl isomerase
MHRLLACLIALVALVAGCGDEEPSRDTGNRLDAVEVTGEAGEKPVLDFEAPFAIDETTSRVIDEGDGDEIAPSSVVTFHFLFVNGRDGKELSTSYESEPAQLVFEKSLMTGVYEGLDGVSAGSRVLVGIAPADGLGADPSQDVRDSDSLLFFAEVLDVRVPLERAEGDAVAPVEGLPTVELDAEGAPTIRVPDAAPPDELVAQPLIEGEGAVVESGQTITVHYTGVLWDGGTEFDSSWEGGAPATFEIGTGGVIPGWDEGLVGQPVGSQVLLVVPPDKGYGESGRGETIPPNASLVFVVDILDAH